MNRSYGRRFLKQLSWIILAILILIIVGMMVGAVIGGGNILTPFLPTTWIHIWKFTN